MSRIAFGDAATGRQGIKQTGTDRMKSEFILAFEEVCKNKNLPPDIVIEALKTALVSAYRRNLGVSNSQEVTVDIDSRTGEIVIFAEKEVVDSVIDSRTEILLEEARRFAPTAEYGDVIMAESTPRNFGRIAAQTAKQVILQRVREAERDHLFDEFAGREGEIVNGTVQNISGGNITIGLGRTEAILPRSQSVPGERYRHHDKIRVYIVEVRRTNRGPQIFVSRNHRNLLRRLLELEVPEIYNGQVDIKSIAREAGARSKVAVVALQPGVDPVGACVGMRGVRIQSIVRELNDEKIDVIEWDPDHRNFIAKALSPARVSQVFLDDDPIGGRTATVVVPDDQLSLAIGREGQNARLAAKLSGWRIDIKSLTEAATDSLDLIDNPAADPAMRDEQMVNLVNMIIEKRQMGRPITAEDYNNLSRFVAGVEGRVIAARASDHEALRQIRVEARDRVPIAYWQLELEELNLLHRVHSLLLENGYETVGDVAFQAELGDDAFLAIEGIGDKAIENIHTRLAEFAEEFAELQLEMVEEATEETDEEAIEEAEIEALVSAEVETIAVETEAESVAVIEPEAIMEESTIVDDEEAPESVPAIDDLSQSLVKETPTKREKPKPVRILAPATPIEEDEDDELDASGKPRKKGRKLVFDENAGRVVAQRKRKRSRRRDEWEDLTDY